MLRPRLSGGLCLLLLPACGADVSSLVGLLSIPIGRDRIPPQIRLICSPIFRDTDLRTIAVTINADIDADASKSGLLTTAASTCTDRASELLTISDTTSLEFDELDAADFEADCFNCYTAIIDSLFDN
jgi:hypothetical protein